MADEFKFKIEESYGVISEGSKGWTTELNLVSWNDRPAKFDIRSWDGEHKKMGKGISLTKSELLKLREILNSFDFLE